jgi:hypothetical protein
MSTPCPPRSLTLFLSGLPPLEINPNVSSRWQKNRITLGEPSAYGFSTLKGISERHATYVWVPTCQLNGLELLQLREMNDLQQQRLALRASNALISLTDRMEYVNAMAANRPGRAIAESFSVGGVNFYYCAFSVILDIPQDFSEGVDSEDLTHLHNVKFIAAES